jgi:hypothetical protein
LMVWLALGRGAGVRSVGSGICRGIGLSRSEVIVAAGGVGCDGRRDVLGELA